MLRTGQISKEWTPELAYVIGLIASDGNLSSDGRHITITSKDESMLKAAGNILKIRNKISTKAREAFQEKKYFALQFGSVDFYTFLLSIGLTPAKSKTIGELAIPPEQFAHFLRGCIDGDGSIIETTHPESRHLQLRVSLASASLDFLNWVKFSIHTEFQVGGGWIHTLKSGSCSSLNFGKEDSIKILKEMYNNETLYRLERKYSVAQKYMD